MYRRFYNIIVDFTTVSSNMGDTAAFTFKFLLVGNSCVGKTCIVRRLCHDDFLDGIPSTVGVEFMACPIEIEQQIVKLQIWDTAGQEKYQSVGKAYYRNAVGVLLVFSLTDHLSFEALGKWYDQVMKYCHPKARLIVVGNKADLIAEKAVTDAEIQSFVESRGLEYLESSAKINKNIKEAFYTITKEIYHMVITGDLVVSESPSTRVGRDEVKREKKNCC